MPEMSTPAFHATLAALARPLDLRGLPRVALHGVMAIRLCALFEKVQREPLAELAQRFRSFEAAEAMLALVSETGRAWPDPFTVNRPCCLALSPDEATLAAMLRSAARADRAGFVDTLAGFVRADRHERLYEASVRAAALLGSVNA